MVAASRSLATALEKARFASGLLRPSYTIIRDTTKSTKSSPLRLDDAWIESSPRSSIGIPGTPPSPQRGTTLDLAA
jgi:hypothetical protein